MVSKYKILIVDDDKAIRKILEQQLNSSAEKIYSAGNVPEAISIIEKEDIDILITDILMPGKNGLELLQFTEQNYPKITKIILSGHGDRETVIKSLRMGIFDFIDKPFKNEELLNCLKRLNSKTKTISTRKSNMEQSNIDTSNILAWLISNNSDLQNTFQEIFSTITCNFINITSLEQAETDVKNNFPDIIFIDVDISRENSFNFIKAVKQNHDNKAIHIAMLSTFKENFIINAAFQAGVDDYIFKPIHPTQIKTTITGLIKKISMLKTSVYQAKENLNKLQKEFKDKEKSFKETSAKLKDLESKLNKTSKEKINIQNEIKNKEELFNKEKEYFKNLKHNFKETENQLTQKTKKIEQLENKLNDSSKERINLVKEIDALKQKSKPSKISDSNLSEAIEEKDKMIDKLSNIISERSKLDQSKAKDKKAVLDQNKLDEMNIKKLKTEAKKDSLDEIKKQLNEKYTHLNHNLKEAIKNLSSLALSLENSMASKDNVIEDTMKKNHLFIDEMNKEISKYKRLYFKASGSEEGEAAVDISENERTNRSDELFHHSKKQLQEINIAIEEAQEEAKQGINKIEESSQKISEELITLQQTYEKTEKEWLFLLQDHYKEKYFDLLDKYNGQILELEEKDIAIGILKKQQEKNENLITFLREKNK